MSEPHTPDTGTPSPRRRAKGRRRKPQSARRKVFLGTAWTAAGLVVLGGTGAGYLYFKLNDNITGVDIDNQLKGDDRPENVDNGSQDILVMGSDSRSGANAEYGKDQGGARSDTAMVVHVYEGHKKASVVSIPRDTLISRPDCESKDGGGTTPAAERQMFNSAYEIGGPACAVKTVESLSGIRMDHYLEVDFTGFKKLIDTLGGVGITTSKPIDDPKSHLRLDPGRHQLNGEQSLGLVRTRHAVGDGSDLGRIQLQQAFIKALIAQVKQVDVFGSPKKMYDLADTATSAVTTDSGLDSVRDLSGFARGLSGIGGEDMKMVTLPVEYDPADPNRVLPQEKADRKVWAALREDRPIPASATEDSAGDKGSAGGVVGAG
ncbi:MULTISPECIES: LCP family protein [Streptomyces]|uniref:Putative transcriptional regulator n=1 Tax=Streptomyces albus (strain ATCC 21838 / DSM 41398 / FERM P-419 / JCM 4703 / NBRC 107858) TaxID=1081613 RepID=A0A0B5EW48_STRA4|nr:LCP family protein [Streptomyces sp. SCSIO ZS0520]AJE82312.1 putative transcriptional regulator [Streptomyces albus]